ncbi:MAG: ABC transporter ATP-binding protein [Candidatus Neomarinimicrobiota bacterium]|nr:ABC transporter ATP-binding protein [Candidatus Neomarinimicrobiota bacterium]
MILSAKNLSKSFMNNEGKFYVFRNLSIEIDKSDLITIMGPSGSGKSTLLNILGTLDTYDEGLIKLNGEDINDLSKDDISKIRNKQIGFVFQFHHLIPEFNAIENIMIPQQIYGNKVNSSDAAELLDYMGLSKRMSHYPSQLSGGEKSRIAIARALINKPTVVLADEPTGNLDIKNAEKLIHLFKKINNDFDQSFVIATHDPKVALIGNKKYYLNKGILSNSDPV